MYTQGRPCFNHFASTCAGTTLHPEHILVCGFRAAAPQASVRCTRPSKVRLWPVLKHQIVCLLPSPPLPRVLYRKPHGQCDDLKYSFAFGQAQRRVHRYGMCIISHG